MALLLADPRLKINSTSAFAASVYAQGNECLKMLLSHPRVDIFQPFGGQSPLRIAVQYGDLEKVQYILAYGSEMDSLAGRDNYYAHALKLATRKSLPGNDFEAIAATIAESRQDPREARMKLWRTIGIRESFIGTLFALIIFFTDGYVRLSPSATPAVARFFGICSRFPMEIQMLLCSRVFGSRNDIVRSSDSAPAFELLESSVVWLPKEEDQADHYIDLDPGAVMDDDLDTPESSPEYPPYWSDYGGYISWE